MAERWVPVWVARVETRSISHRGLCPGRPVAALSGMVAAAFQKPGSEAMARAFWLMETVSSSSLVRGLRASIVPPSPRVRGVAG